jgi:hypothetical protein
VVAVSLRNPDDSDYPIFHIDFLVPLIKLRPPYSELTLDIV